MGNEKLVNGDKEFLYFGIGKALKNSLSFGGRVSGKFRRFSIAGGVILLLMVV